MKIGILKRAYKEAENSKAKFKFGAVIFKGSRIISSATNTLRHCGILPQFKKYSWSLHAEQAAISNIDWNIVRGCSILVIRINNDGKLMLAKPCGYCMKSLMHVSLKKLFYSDCNGEIVMEKLKEI